MNTPDAGSEITFALSGRIMLDMQVIEALYLKDKEPHDYLQSSRSGRDASGMSEHEPSSRWRRNAMDLRPNAMPPTETADKAAGQYASICHAD
jgi:hypothetical protein